MEVLHFNSPEERLKYLKGEFEEIVPIEAKETEEKPKKAKKSAKKSKKEDGNDEVQAE